MSSDILSWMPSDEKNDLKEIKYKKTMHEQFTVLKYKHKNAHHPLQITYEYRGKRQK
jgi:hypothetical protein